MNDERAETMGDERVETGESAPAMLDLTQEQLAIRQRFRRFAEEVVGPCAAQIDREACTPPALIAELSRGGCLGAMLPTAVGGLGLGAIAGGLIHEELGRVSASVQGLVNVHNMASQAFLRWGSASQKARWLADLGAGSRRAGLAITEPTAGSDAKSVTTTAVDADGGFVLHGEKKWITAGQIADLLLVLAQYEGHPTVFLLERDTPGFTVTPTGGMLGCRGYMLAQLRFDGCRIAREALIGRPGFGLSHVIATALDAGRYALSWSCVGLAQAALEATLRYVRERVQFGVPLIKHELIQHMVTAMVVNTRAARLLCHRAGVQRERGEPGAVLSTLMAKYFASRLATASTGDAVQIHGANGCSAEYPVERYLRDARIMEIIEGTTQIHEMLIARSVS